MLVGMVTSCFHPATKDDYLEKFTRFVDNVREDHSNYNKSDWDYADSRFNKFSTEWYEKFESGLTLKEEIKVKSLIVQYNSYKGTDQIKKFYNDEVKENVDELKEKIEYYIDNDMDEDLDKLIEGAKEIGDSTLKVVEDIIESIKN